MINSKHIAKTMSKLKKLEDVYAKYIFEKASDLQFRYMETDEHLHHVPGDEWPWQPVAQGTPWGHAWGSVWFKGTFKVPASLQGQKLFISAQTDAVETFFWVDGKPRGIFTHPVESSNLGQHGTLLLADDCEAGTVFELAFEGYAGNPVIGTQPYEYYNSADGYPYRFERVFQSIDVMLCREDVKAFVFDLRTLNQVVASDAVDEFRKAKIVNGLLDVFQVIVQSPEDVPEVIWRQSLADARAIMKPLLDRKNSESAPRAGLIGHSHMDTAWLWTRDETIRKCARTYANVLNLMEQYPEYTFVQSSAFHAELMRRHYPDIFEGIKRRVAEGRWEPNGGVWIECDCNLVSGESMIRQFLKGQRYTREHFGYTADTFWLPDTFGYSAAIPQIMAGFHIEYFLTTKLSWNDTNPFPFDTFRWRGLDGTTVLTHFNSIHCWPDAETLLNRIYGNGTGNGTAIRNDITHKHVNDRRLISYGFGDGGGGPKYEMLEAARRVRDLEGVPKAEHTTVGEFMRELEEASVKPPVHVGELYLEGHRGTLTQMHQIKRNNRKAEFALRNLDFMETVGWLNGTSQPSARREDLYEIMLINQFHDILPGTSLPEVHDRAIREVGEVISETEDMVANLMAATVRPDASKVTVWNTLSWPRAGTISVQGVDELFVPEDVSMPSQRIEDVTGRKKLLVGGVVIPEMGATTIPLKQGASTATSPFQYDGKRLETPFAIIIFDELGYIVSFLDKASGRELRGNGHPLNAFLMGEDVPGAWDNWDIDRDLNGKLRLQTGLIQREVAADGPLQLRIRSHYRIGYHSTLKQDMVFHNDSPRIDFETIIDWKEKHQFLKVGFDVNIWSLTARHETQFGYVDRPTHANTPYDQGMFEVCAHKWTDLSENRFGIAILNDCKYGVSVEGSDIRLSLHKGGCHPDSRGDEGVHEVTYAFLPHNDGFGAENVIRPAYELNVPILSVFGFPVSEIRSFVEIDAPNVILEAVKPAEEDRAYILRLYEAERSGTLVNIRFGTVPKKVLLVNLLEEELEELQLHETQLVLPFRAFEIKSLKVFF
jgi:alpha-mannosidase